MYKFSKFFSLEIEDTSHYFFQCETFTWHGIDYLKGGNPYAIVMSQRPAVTK